jgi:hypothetical protein
MASITPPAHRATLADPNRRAARGSNSRRFGRALPRDAGSLTNATGRRCGCLVAPFAMAASIPYASSCDGPPSATRHDAAITAF